MTKNTIFEAAIQGLINNRRQIARTFGNILFTILHAITDEYLQDANDKRRQ